MKHVNIIGLSKRQVRQMMTLTALSGLSLVGLPAFAQPNLIKTSDGPIAAGNYGNIEIRPGVSATISGTVNVTGYFQVDSAASVNVPGAALITGNLFRMLNDSKLTVGNPNGIAGTTTGSIRTINKNFGTKARITFSNATVAQVTGASFPSELSELVINNSRGVTMSQALGVRERLHLRNGNLITNGFKLTLISRTPDIRGVTAASALIFNQNLTGSIIGDVTAQRYINPRYNTGVGYRHFSSSVHGNAVGDFRTPGFRAIVNPRYNTVPFSLRFRTGQVTPYPNVFFYDETQVGTGGPGTYDKVFEQGYQSPSSLEDPIVITRGYSVRISASETVDFVGSPNNGPYSTGPLTRGPLNESGWHLFGNPYPSKIDWTLVTLTGVDDAFYKNRSLTATTGVYDSYVNGVSTGPSGNEFIAANQAVFVRVSEVGVNGSIDLDNSCRLFEFRDDPTAPFFRGTAGATPRPLARLALENAAGLHDEAVVYFQNGSTTGFDSKYDAYYLNGGNPAAIYAPVGGEKLSINCLPALTAKTDYTVPLVVNTTTAGTYTLNASELLHFPAGFRVELQDALTDRIQDLTLNPVYTFTTTGSSATAPRFSIRFRTNGLTGLADATADGAFDVYPNPVKGTDHLTISVAGVEAGKSVPAALYNSLGQTVWATTLRAALGGVQADVKTGLARGVYTLRLTLPDGSQRSRRVVVE